MKPALKSIFEPSEQQEQALGASVANAAESVIKLIHVEEKQRNLAVALKAAVYLHSLWDLNTQTLHFPSFLLRIPYTKSKLSRHSESSVQESTLPPKVSYHLHAHLRWFLLLYFVRGLYIVCPSRRNSDLMGLLQHYALYAQARLCLAGFGDHPIRPDLLCI